MRCAECGKIVGSIASHIKAHGMNWREYEAKHGKGTASGMIAVPSKSKGWRGDYGR